MINRNRKQPHSRSESPRLRFWNTLAFRVAVVVNLTVVIVFGVFAVIDYRRERSIHIREEFERLREEARVFQNLSRGDSDLEWGCQDPIRRCAQSAGRSMACPQSPSAAGPAKVLSWLSWKTEPAGHHPP